MVDFLHDRIVQGRHRLQGCQHLLDGRSHLLRRSPQIRGDPVEEERIFLVLLGGTHHRVIVGHHFLPHELQQPARTVLQGHDRIHHFADHLLNLLHRNLRTLRQIPDFLGHYRKAPARITRPGRLDGCIERDQIRLARDLPDLSGKRLDDLDLLHFLQRVFQLPGRAVIDLLRLFLGRYRALIKLVRPDIDIP